jgi:hypothetical protein
MLVPFCYTYLCCVFLLELRDPRNFFAPVPVDHPIALVALWLWLPFRRQPLLVTFSLSLIAKAKAASQTAKSAFKEVFKHRAPQLKDVDIDFIVSQDGASISIHEVVKRNSAPKGKQRIGVQINSKIVFRRGQISALCFYLR